MSFSWKAMQRYVLFFILPSISPFFCKKKHFYLFVASFDGCRVRYYRKIAFPKVFNRLEYFGFGSGGSVPVLGYLDGMWKNDDFYAQNIYFPILCTLRRTFLLISTKRYLGRFSRTCFSTRLNSAMAYCFDLSNVSFDI